jgi:hypothetical protein
VEYLDNMPRQKQKMAEKLREKVLEEGKLHEDLS